jgi:hypothetical protein
VRANGKSEEEGIMSENSINRKYERVHINLYFFLIVHLIVFPVDWMGGGA